MVKNNKKTKQKKTTLHSVNLQCFFKRREIVPVCNIELCKRLNITWYFDQKSIIFRHKKLLTIYRNGSFLTYNRLKFASLF